MTASTRLSYSLGKRNKCVADYQFNSIFLDVRDAKEEEAVNSFLLACYLHDICFQIPMIIITQC
jgi:hypothetical protein